MRPFRRRCQRPALSERATGTGRIVVARRTQTGGAGPRPPCSGAQYATWLESVMAVRVTRSAKSLADANNCPQFITLIVNSLFSSDFLTRPFQCLDVPDHGSQPSKKAKLTRIRPSAVHTVRLLKYPSKYTWKCSKVLRALGPSIPVKISRLRETAMQIARTVTHTISVVYLRVVSLTDFP